MFGRDNRGEKCKTKLRRSKRVETSVWVFYRERCELWKEKLMVYSYPSFTSKNLHTDKCGKNLKPDSLYSISTNQSWSHIITGEYFIKVGEKWN